MTARFAITASFRLFVALGALQLHALSTTFSTRAGWAVAPTAQDLIQAANWSCAAVNLQANGALSISAGSDYNSVWLTNGPNLQVNGDFSVLVRLAAPGGSLTLIGQQPAPGAQWWQGLKRLDVGVGGNVAVNMYLGSSSNPTATTFAAPSNLTVPIDIEVARLGAQLTIFINGTQVGSVPDPGIFVSGNVYYGFTVSPGGQLTVQGLAAAVPASMPGNAVLYYPYRHVSQRTGTALRDSAEKVGLPIGAAVTPSYFTDPNYAETLGREFNLLVAETVMKFAETEPSQGVYTFCDADEVTDFAEANGMGVRGHNLIWNTDLPDWLTTGNFSRDQAIAIMHDHINTVMSHFKRKVRYWDVVNEAVGYNGNGLAPSFWLQTIGTDYIDLAFQFARQADPTAELYYNDSGGEGLGPKSDAIYNLVQGMLSRGIPLDGVGLEMHLDENMQFDNNTPPWTAQSIAANIQRLASLGLKVQITEMDVRLPLPATASELAAQSAIYQNVSSVCAANPNCESFLTWGVADAYTWIPAAYPGFGAPLLFDAQFHEKPAWTTLNTVLQTLSPPAAGCTYSLSTISVRIGSSATSGFVSVVAPSACSWTASSSASWLHVMNPQTGIRTGPVIYGVDANTGPQRSTNLTIAGKSVLVTQASGLTPQPLGFFAVTPCRAVDTRASQGKSGNYGPPAMGAYSGRDFPLMQSGCGLPSTAQAYSLNFTVVPPGPLDFLSAWPSNQPFPGVSTLNSPDGTVIANAAIVPNDPNGNIRVTTGESTDLIIDTNGYFAPSNGSELAFYPVTPCRIVDTRTGYGKSGAFGPPALAAYSGRTFPIRSSSCNVPVNAQAYALNLTVVPPGPLSFLSIWPADKPFPGVSTLNSNDGSIIANAAIVPAAGNGDVTITAGNATDFIMDINGYFAAPAAPGALHFYSVPPCRVADTRASQGFTGPFGPPALSPYQGRSFPIQQGACFIPSTAKAYSLNFTVVPQGPLSFLSAWPSDKPFPGVSTLNSPKGLAIANAAIVPAAANGSITVTAGNPTDLIIDIDGYFAP